MSNQNTVQIDSFPQKKYTCVHLARAKSSIFKKLGKHWLRFPHLKREFGACLNAQDFTRQKKVDIGEKVQPKHSANRYFCASEIDVCRFGGGLKVASLKR